MKTVIVLLRVTEWLLGGTLLFVVVKLITVL